MSQSPTSNTPASFTSIYLDRRVFSIFFLGISQGFPWLLIGSMLSIWLKQSGFSRSDIGFAGAIFAVYSINFLWSPLVDRVSLGKVGRWLGQRRSWIVCMQLGIALCAFAMSAMSPNEQAQGLIIVALLLACLSATQDIAIDAFRIDTFAPHETQSISAAAAMATAGWWTGYAGLGILPLWLSDQPGWNWTNIYPLMACVMVLLTLAPLLNREPVSNRDQQFHSLRSQYLLQTRQHSINLCWRLIASVITAFSLLIWAVTGRWGISSTLDHLPWWLIITVGEVALGIAIAKQLRRLSAPSQSNSTTLYPTHWTHHLLAWLIASIIQPIREFFQRNGWQLAAGLLAFIFLFKIGEAFLGRMSTVFYLEVGFTTADIGLYSKGINWITTIIFSILGSMVTIKLGIVRGLMIGGIAMAASNLLFAVMWHVGPSKELLVGTVIVDGFTGAWATVATISLIALLCNRTFTASQYALLASLSTLGRTLVSSSSGAMVDALDGNWPLFFVLTAVMVIPSLVLLRWMSPHIRRLEQVPNDH